MVNLQDRKRNRFHTAKPNQQTQKEESNDGETTENEAQTLWALSMRLQWMGSMAGKTAALKLVSMVEILTHCTNGFIIALDRNEIPTDEIYFSIEVME